MASITENQGLLISKLREMFQFDQADLDFGIYRIMNFKRNEINQFLKKDLITQISEQIVRLTQNKNFTKIAEIDKQIEDTKKLNLSSETKDQALGELKKQKQALSCKVSLEDLEADIYSHLTEFFSRYYDAGDFISQRRYKDGAYAIPYEGEEVKLHWANADQYYVKTSENFKNYTFKTESGKTVHFHIVDAETEKDNNKSVKDRRFQLLTENPVVFFNDELTIYFEYKASTDNQAKHNAEAVETLSAIIAKKHTEFAELLKPVDDKDKTVLSQQLNRYTAKNTFDYFIHKDLGKFLSRELDFYIKNDVIFLDDIDTTDDATTEAYLLKAKVIREIGKKIIDFLAQLENFQKELWLKKKFVTETNYGITLDLVSKELYPEIAQNEAQRKEWVELFAIDEIEGDLTKPAYSEPLTVEFLMANEKLVLDTRHFDESLKERLIGSIENFDEQCNGLLIHSENFQALNLLQQRYREQIKCIHVDPPYNTDTSGFLYKNTYRHSSWLSMMDNRIECSLQLLNNSGSYICHIDENEYERLHALLDNTNLVTMGTVIWDKRNPMTGGKGIATQHEYIIWKSKSDETININSGIISMMLANLDELIKKHGCIDVDVKNEYAQWISSNNTLSGGEKAYRYVDDDGRIFQSVSLRAPEKRTNKKFHIPLIHPITGKACQVPPNGFSRTPETLLEMINNNEIIFGIDETTQPRQKMFLSAEKKRQLTTIIQNAMKGKADTDRLGIAFPYCHPVSLYKSILITTICDGEFVLDYFAGSGTTGHAVINLNREDGGKRKYILVEMGEYFDTEMKPRIAKVVYATAWKDGKPNELDKYIKSLSLEIVQLKKDIKDLSGFETLEEYEFEKQRLNGEIEKNIKLIAQCKQDMATGNKFGGVSHCFKYIRLESYEDTLNNIELKDDGLFAQIENGRIKEQYILRYMLGNESKESPCLLDIDMLAHPFDYALKITRKQEMKETPVDLVETFNYLIGLKVKKSYAKESYDAEFTTSDDAPTTASLKTGDTYKFKVVEGITLTGVKTLIIWRDLTGDAIKDNVALDAYFTQIKDRYAPFDFKKIFVNGDNNLLNLRTDKEHWDVLLIEEEMKMRMFESKTV